MENSIAAADLAELMASGKPLTLLDVRRREDYEASPEMMEGAQWKDPAKIDQWQATIPKEQEAIIYCARGGPVSQGVGNNWRMQAFRRDTLQEVWRR